MKHTCGYVLSVPILKQLHMVHGSCAPVWESGQQNTAYYSFPTAKKHGFDYFAKKKLSLVLRCFLPIIGKNPVGKMQTYPKDRQDKM